MNYPNLRLMKDQERRVLAGHNWIYSNEIDNKSTPLKALAVGSLARLETANGTPLGIVYVNANTLLCARLLTTQPREQIDTEFFSRRIKQALQWREQNFDQPFYRLIYSESDGLPGLIVDRFGDTLVGQINTAGMQALLPFITEALINVIQPAHILWRNDNTYRQLEGLALENSIGHGKPADMCLVQENNSVFHAPILEGQKTGWFYDHRMNRAALLKYVKNKKVLDIFSYLGAFAIPAAKAGANEVTCIDASETAIQLIQQNAELNHVGVKVKTIHADAFVALEKLIATGEKFDVIILDPPAFIKRKKDVKPGSIAYQKINYLALQLLNSTGVLLSASCSMHLSRDELLNLIRRAGLKAHKTIRVLEQLHQGSDHPIHPSIEETNYLKGFILGINSN